jgi:hypothetical protein
METEATLLITIGVIPAKAGIQSPREHARKRMAALL